MGVVARLNQYASILAIEFDEISQNNFSISVGGTCYSNQFVENIDVPVINNIYPAYNIVDSLFAEVSSGVGLSYPGRSLTANAFAPYDPVSGEFASALYGPGQGTFMRRDYLGDLIVYNDIDEITDFRDIVRNGLVLDLDAGMNASFNNTGTAWYDISGNNNTGILTNGPTYDIANSGSIVFDGVNDCVVVNSNASILPSTAYTKIVWFNVSSFSSINNIISGGNGSSHILWLSAGNILNAGHNGVWNVVSSKSSIDLNTWYCATVTFSNSTGWSLYLNGAVENTRTDNFFPAYNIVDGLFAEVSSGVGYAATTTFTGKGEVLIGAYGTGSNTFSGKISNAQIYNRALTATEVVQNFNALRNRFGL